MIQKNTLFVLGAGASRPYLFPTGAELRNLILQRDENPDLLQNMGFNNGVYYYKEQMFAPSENNTVTSYRAWIEKRLGDHEVEEYQLREFQERFASSQFYSIDAFIAANPFYKVLGSLMIAAILLKCEQEKKLSGDWYQILFNELVSEGKDFPSDRLSVVTFNYDRSLEMYLNKAFRCAFDLQPASAWSMVERIKIVHVYGDLGSLPASGEKDPVRYGDAGAMRQASERIQLMSPRAAEAKSAQISSIMEAASKVVYLGFGFDPMNLNVVGARPVTTPTYASCYHLSGAAMKRVENRIAALSHNIIYQGAVLKWGDRSHTVGDFLHNSEALA